MTLSDPFLGDDYFILLPSNRSPLLDHVVDLLVCVVVKYLVPMAAYYITVLFCSVHMLCCCLGTRILFFDVWFGRLLLAFALF